MPVDVVATLFGVSPRRVQQLVKEGVLPRATRGRYHQAECVRAYIAYLQGQIREANARASAANPSPLLDERTLRIRADRELMEFRLQREREEVVLRSEVAQVWDRTCSVLRARVVSLRGKWASRFVQLQSMGDAARTLDSLSTELLQALREGADEIEAEDPPVAPPANGSAA